MSRVDDVRSSGHFVFHQMTIHLNGTEVHNFGETLPVNLFELVPFLMLPSAPFSP
jgi:hypothetical protein